MLPNVTVLAFPTNQFGLQEPGKNHEILNVLKYVRPGRGYEPNFPIFEKMEVNGEGEHPVFAFMKAQCHSVTSRFAPQKDLYWEPIRPNDIEWNFHKFLVDKEGRVYRRYNHNVPPQSPVIKNDIEKLLA